MWLQLHINQYNYRLSSRDNGCARRSIEGPGSFGESKYYTLHMTSQVVLVQGKSQSSNMCLYHSLPALPEQPIPFILTVPANFTRKSGIARGTYSVPADVTIPMSPSLQNTTARGPEPVAVTN
jgi:hypothetical protein